MKPNEIELMINYFHGSDRDFLRGMGVYFPNLPDPGKWLALLQEDFAKPIPERAYYYTVWERDGQPIGHCNVNELKFGEQAKMHLHMWTRFHRQLGMGTWLVRQSVAQFFTKLQLKALYCEPYALNPAPNKTVAKAGFTYLYTYETTPGWLNFHQPVKRWVHWPA